MAYVRIIAMFTILGMGAGCTQEALEHWQRLEAHYRLQQPEGAGPFPAIMLVPGCGGASSTPTRRAHYREKVTWFLQRGYVVVIVDYLAARSVASCHPHVALEDVARDILTTAAYLRALPFVQDTAIHVIGWSYGGGGALAALAAMPVDTPPPVQAMVAFYPVCRRLQPWRAKVPVLMLLGADDVITPPYECQTLVQQVSQKARVTMKLYPKASHGFDVKRAEADAPVRGRVARLGGYQRGAAAAAWQAIAAFLQPVR